MVDRDEFAPRTGDQDGGKKKIKAKLHDAPRTYGNTHHGSIVLPDDTPA
jgi:hypothetical protein